MYYAPAENDGRRSINLSLVDELLVFFFTQKNQIAVVNSKVKSTNTKFELVISMKWQIYIQVSLTNLSVNFKFGNLVISHVMY